MWVQSGAGVMGIGGSKEVASAQTSLPADLRPSPCPQGDSRKSLRASAQWVIPVHPENPWGGNMFKGSKEWFYLLGLGE